MKAIWKGAVIAESPTTVELEGNHYFPEASVKREHLRPSDTHTTCHWKGVASYHHVVLGDDVSEDAAWYYPDPSAKAQRIKGHIAFWRGVEVVP